MAQVTQVYGGDEINAIVLDPGAAWTRVGWSAEDGPGIAYSTPYALREGQASYGDEGTYMVRPNTEILNPLSDSVVVDWDRATELWKAALSQASPQRDTEYVSESPLFMTEPFWNSRQAQKKSMEFALAELGAPAFFIAKSPVLSLFAAGRGSGIVVDAGAQTLSVTPVIDGLCLYKPARRSRRAGDFLSDKVKSLLNTDIIPGYEIKSKRAVGLEDSADFTKRTDLPEGITESFRNFQVSRVVEQFKESMIQISETPYNKESAQSQKPRTFEFPDGHSLQLQGERFELGESLFTDESTSPSSDRMDVDEEANSAEKKAKDSTDVKKEAKTKSNANDEDSDHAFNDWSAKGASDLIVECLNACDVDARANLANNIVITGGTTLTQGFTERINQTLQREFPMLKIRIFASGNMVERRNSAWIGGSILSSLGTFHQMWISKQEFEEVGAEQLAQKRFK